MTGKLGHGLADTVLDWRLARSFDYKGYRFSGFRLPQDSETAVGQLLWRGIAIGEDGKPLDVFFRLFIPLPPHPKYTPMKRIFELVAAKIEAARLKADEMKLEVEAKKEVLYDRETWTCDDEVVEIPAHTVKIQSIRWIDDYQNGETAWKSEKS